MVVFHQHSPILELWKSFVDNVVLKKHAHYQELENFRIFKTSSEDFRNLWICLDLVHSRKHPCYAGEIWKHSFISSVRLTIHTNSSQKHCFSKMFFKLEEFENARVSFWYGLKHFENKAFCKQQCRSNYNHGDFLARVFVKHKSKMNSYCCILNSSGIVLTENILMHFQSETSVFKFLWHSVDKA